MLWKSLFVSYSALWKPYTSIHTVTHICVHVMFALENSGVWPHIYPKVSNSNCITHMGESPRLGMNLGTRAAAFLICIPFTDCLNLQVHTYVQHLIAIDKHELNSYTCIKILLLLYGVMDGICMFHFQSRAHYQMHVKCSDFRLPSAVNWNSKEKNYHGHKTIWRWEKKPKHSLLHIPNTFSSDTA